MEWKSMKELECLGTEEKLRYFSELREYCSGLRNKNAEKTNFKREALMGLYQKIVPGYDYVIEGKENIPKDGNALFVCNHSNSHDFFAAQEVMRRLGLRVSVLAGSDCLNLPNQAIFNACDGVLIDRRDSNSTQAGIMNFSGNIINGFPGWIFGESTWNLHPIKAMQPIKIGATLVGAITDVYLVPVTFEYVEVPHLCTSEKELYIKCIVRFGKPIKINREQSLKLQSDELLSLLTANRKGVWNDIGIKRDSLRDIDPALYLNHTYIKKFLSFGFQYDSQYESQFIYKPKDMPFENEYRLDENGIFVPGVTTKEEGRAYVKKM